MGEVELDGKVLGLRRGAAATWTGGQLVRPSPRSRVRGPTGYGHRHRRHGGAPASDRPAQTPASAHGDQDRPEAPPELPANGALAAAL